MNVIPPRSTCRKLGLSDVVNKGNGSPNRFFVFGPEGSGKTSLAAASPRPIVFMTRGETGLLTLLDYGLVAPTPHFPEISTWAELLDALRVLLEQPHEFKTLVIDTVNGAERLCHEHVCRREFGGKWGRDGFTAFMTGYEVALADWREFLGLLDRLREVKRMGIVALAHSRIATFKNPEGSDYDRFVPDLHARTWALTSKWADSVLFLNFETFVDSDRSELKGKGKGGSRRKLYTQRTAAFDAKNRHGLPAEIDGGRSAAELWLNLATAMKAARTATPPSTDSATVADVPAEDSQS